MVSSLFHHDGPVHLLLHHYQPYWTVLPHCPRDTLSPSLWAATQFPIWREQPTICWKSTMASDRGWGADSHCSCFTLSCKLLQCALEVTRWWNQQNYIICKYRIRRVWDLRLWWTLIRIWHTLKHVIHKGVLREEWGATWDVWRGKSRSGGKQIDVTTEVYQLMFPNSIYTVLTTGMHTQELGCICLKEGGVFWGRTVCINVNTALSHVDTTRTSGVAKLNCPTIWVKRSGF